MSEDGRRFRDAQSTPDGGNEALCTPDVPPMTRRMKPMSETVTCTSDEFLRDPEPWLDAMHSGKNVIVEPVNGGARMWLSGKPLSEINLEADEFAPKTPNEKRDHYADLLRHVDANSNRHPWYGPCDGLGRGGSCSECDRLCGTLFVIDAETAAKLEDAKVEENRRTAWAEVAGATTPYSSRAVRAAVEETERVRRHLVSEGLRQRKSYAQIARDIGISAASVANVCKRMWRDSAPNLPFGRWLFEARGCQLRDMRRRNPQ